MKPRRYEQGLCKEEVLDRIGRGGWLEFCKWFNGQTGAIAPDGTLLYYEWDVDKYLSNKRNVDVD